jgi:preprotein translocase subunit Sss1
MVERFVDIVRSNAVELGIIGVVGFVVLLVLVYAVLKSSDRAIRIDEQDRLR